MVGESEGLVRGIVPIDLGVMLGELGGDTGLSQLLMPAARGYTMRFCSTSACALLVLW